MSRIRGVDVSSHQGKIDWNAVKKDGIDFVLLRSSIGDDTDSTFFDNVRNAQSAGIKIEGIYHFSYAVNTAQAEEEAEFAVDHAKKAGLKDVVVFFDFEYESEDYCKKNKVSVTPSFVQGVTKAFCERVKKLGFIPGVYANGDYYYRYYNGGKGLPSYAAFWYADWRTNPDVKVVESSIFYQFSSTGKIAGIKGNVDLNYDMRTQKNDIPSEPKKEEKPKSLTTAEIETIAKDVIAGKYGNGDERKKKLGDNYTIVQNRVNELIKRQEKPQIKKVDDTVVTNVIAGKFGNGDERKKRLEAAGYNYREVQDAVNAALKQTNKAVSPALGFDQSLSGTYTVTAEVLNMRYIPGLLTSNNIMKLLYKNETVQCWGYYTDKEGTRWLYVQKGNYTGHVNSNFLKKN